MSTWNCNKSRPEAIILQFLLLGNSTYHSFHSFSTYKTSPNSRTTTTSHSQHTTCIEIDMPILCRIIGSGLNRSRYSLLAASSACNTAVSRLFNIVLNKRPIMPFSNAAKCSLLCHSSSAIIPCYTLNKNLVIHFVKHYNNNIISLFCCIEGNSVQSSIECCYIQLHYYH